MAFGSLAFLLLFLPGVLGLYLLACRRLPTAAVAVLPAATVAFCLLNDPRALLYLAASIVGNFLLVATMRRLPPESWRRQGLLAGGILLNLLPLAVFKTLNLSALGVMGYLGDENVQATALPLGLAFYTLQQITFLIDSQKQGAPRLGFLRYTAWGSLFCQLPAGPVAAYGTTARQYERLGHAVPAAGAIACGLTLFLVGLLKKNLLADSLGRSIAPIYEAAETGAVSMAEAWAAGWGFMLQLYFDFSAYSDMAIGLALCFGLRLPVNFNSPLKATSLGDYVLRWHMSLTGFVREYVFQPVFRQLLRLPLPLSKVRLSITAWAGATLASYLAIGAWHSPAAIVLAQAAGVAALTVLMQLWRAASTSAPAAARARRGEAAGVVPQWVRRRGGQILVLVMASVVALIFRAQTSDGLDTLLRALVSFQGGYHMALNPLKLGVVIGVCSVVALVFPNTMQIFGLVGDRITSPFRALSWRPSRAWGWATGAALVAVLLFLSGGGQQEFIYAQF